MYLEFKYENTKELNSNCLRQNFVITWEQEIINCFINNLLLGNVPVIVHICSFTLCTRHSKFSLLSPSYILQHPLNHNSSKSEQICENKAKNRNEIYFENLYAYISSYRPLNFCSGVGHLSNH